MGANDQDDVPEKLRGWELTPALLPAFNYVSSYESGGRPDILNGGKETFDTSGTHPNRIGKGGTSRAAGYTQWMPKTWENVAGSDTPMSEENQKRAFAKYASIGYKQRTGRDLAADIEENGGVTPEIASILDANQLGIKSMNGAVLGNIKGGNRITQDQAMGLYRKGNKMADDDQIQYGGGQQGPYSSSTRMGEGNIPFQQKAEKVGLLGMLGVQTTPAERMALMKMGSTMMTTVGNPLTALGAGIGSYVDEMKAQNKAQADLAKEQTSAKEAEGRSRQAASASTKVETAGPFGIIGSTTPASGDTNVFNVPTPKSGTSTNLPTGGKGGTTPKSAVNVGEEGAVTIDPEALKSTTTADVSNPSSAAPKVQSAAKKIAENFDLGSIYSDDPSSVDKRELLKRAIGKEPDNAAYASKEGEWSKRFQERKEHAETVNDTTRSNLNNLSEYADALVKAPKDGIFAMGAKGDTRVGMGANLLMGLNSVGLGEKELKAMGLGDQVQKLQDAKNAVDAKIIIEKIGNQVARENNPGMNVAARWLEDTKNSLINYNNTPEANANLLANMFVARKQAKDNYRVINEIGPATNYTGYGRTSEILEKVNPSSNYVRDGRIVAELLNPNSNHMINQKIDGKQYSVATAYMQHKITKKQFNEYALKTFGIHNASSYFD